MTNTITITETTESVDINDIHKIAEVPTVYHGIVKRIFERGSKKQRDSLLKDIQESLLSKRINFYQLFPNKSLRKDVFKRILLLLSRSGICVIERKTLMEQLNCGKTTVDDVIKIMKQLDEFVITHLADGNNKPIFILKTHENYQRILEEVFFLNITGEVVEKEEVKTDNGKHNGKLNGKLNGNREGAENVDMTASNAPKTSPKSLSLLSPLSSKQRDIYITDFKNQSVKEFMEIHKSKFENKVSNMNDVYRWIIDNENNFTEEQLLFGLNRVLNYRMPVYAPYSFITSTFSDIETTMMQEQEHQQRKEDSKQRNKSNARKYMNNRNNRNNSNMNGRNKAMEASQPEWFDKHQQQTTEAYKRHEEAQQQESQSSPEDLEERRRKLREELQATSRRKAI